jgi:hypothetical protein
MLWSSKLVDTMTCMTISWAWQPISVVIIPRGEVSVSCNSLNDGRLPTLNFYWLLLSCTSNRLIRILSLVRTLQRARQLPRATRTVTTCCSCWNEIRSGCRRTSSVRRCCPQKQSLSDTGYNVLLFTRNYTILLYNDVVVSHAEGCSTRSIDGPWRRRGVGGYVV